MASGYINNLYSSLSEDTKQNTFIDFKLNKSENIPLIILHPTDIYVFYNEVLYLLPLDNALLLLILIPVAIILVILYYKGFMLLIYSLFNGLNELIGDY